MIEDRTSCLHRESSAADLRPSRLRITDPMQADDEEAMMAKAKWRVYLFNKAGKSFRGHTLFASKAACERGIARSEGRLKAGVTLVSLDGDHLEPGDYHHGMPMPEMA